MKRFLLLLGVAATLAATPAFAQYMYLDTNNDGVCNASDVLSSSTTSVDVWVDTNHDKFGNVLTCPDGANTFSLLGYELILSWSGSGSLTYGTFTNLMAGMNNLSQAAGGNDYYTTWVTLTAFPESSSPFKVASIGVTVTGTPVLTLATSTSLAPVDRTSFGSLCTTVAPGHEAENQWILGTDFFDVCGTSTLTPTTPTTWGAIKNLYK
jgi:hypothetical protein